MKFDTTYLAIDFDALEENLSAIRAKAGTKILAVVKADAYGHGAVPIAAFLESRVDFLGVARIEEAMELRNAGISLPILILGHTPRTAFPELVKAQFRPTLFRLDDAEALSQEAVRQGCQVPVHLAVDTGMSRIGFQADEEGTQLCLKVAALPGLCIEGLFSHYATADEPDLTRAKAQLQLFHQFVETLSSRGIHPTIVHMSNSAGLMNFSCHHNMVRAGIVLYGDYPSTDVPAEQLPVRPVLSWHSRITCLKTLPAGRQVSYGGTYTTTAQTRVATVPVGYADGYCRSLSGSFHVLIHGKKAPILGRVCMDQFMVDVTNIPEARPDDEVVLLGKSGDQQITLQQIAQAADTIPYEFLCSLHHRVPRYYFQKGALTDTRHYLPAE